jgi:hypothetical protein
LDFAVADAGGADANPLTGALYERVHRLKIQIPAALCHIVGVADAMPELRSTTAHFTNFCHIYVLSNHCAHERPDLNPGGTSTVARMEMSVQPRVLSHARRAWSSGKFLTQDEPEGRCGGRQQSGY